MTTDAVNIAQQTRKPPLADWPTIKILTPPKGKFSPKNDEWCFSYCSQSVTGRFHQKEPFCRSFCIRKVFAHEVKNVVGFKTHRAVGPDGKMKYALPSEGQPVNLPRVLGGTSPDDSDDPSQKLKSESTNHWNEGWYLWTTHSRWGIHQKMISMTQDLERQRKFVQMQEHRREVWQDYQDHLAKRSNQPESQQTTDSNRWWGSIVPSRPWPETKSHSLLVPLPPDFPPFWDRINKLLVPTHRVLEIFRESIISGEQRQFAVRVWEKAWTKEPFILARRTIDRAYELWKDREAPADEDEGKNGSNRG